MHKILDLETSLGYGLWLRALEHIHKLYVLL